MQGCRGSPPVRDSLKVADDAVFLLRTELVPPGKRPCSLIVAVRAVVGTARYEQGAAGAGSVDDINGNVFEVMHSK